jgi:glutamine amidotransferase-like uncharacterized protein
MIKVVILSGDDTEAFSSLCVDTSLTVLNKSTFISAVKLDILNIGKLSNMLADIFIITGGEPYKIRGLLGGVGSKAIRQFVSNGGKYIGVCAGVVLATANRPTLDLLQGVQCVNDNIWRDSGLSGRVQLRSSAPMSMMKQVLTKEKMCYLNGPLLKIKKRYLDAIQILCQFQDYVVPWDPDVTKQEPKKSDMIDSVAVLVGKYKDGIVLISSIHPEFTDTVLVDICLYIHGYE